MRDWLDDPDFWVHHTHPDDVDRCATFCREATRRGEDHQFDYRMHAADGRIVWLRDIVSVRTTADGGRRLVGIALDITSEKQEQADRRRIAQLYERLIENSSDIISLIRPDGITVYQSQAVQPELGYDRGELTGRNNFDLVHPEDVERIRTKFTRAVRVRRGDRAGALPVPAQGRELALPGVGREALSRRRRARRSLSSTRAT